MAERGAAGGTDRPARRIWVKRVVLGIAIALLAIWLLILIRMLLTALAGPA